MLNLKFNTGFIFIGYSHLADKRACPFVHFKKFLHPTHSYCTLPVYQSSKSSAVCLIIRPSHFPIFHHLYCQNDCILLDYWAYPYSNLIILHNPTHLLSFEEICTPAYPLIRHIGTLPDYQILQKLQPFPFIKPCLFIRKMS